MWKGINGKRKDSGVPYSSSREGEEVSSCLSEKKRIGSSKTSHVPCLSLCQLPPDNLCSLLILNQKQEKVLLSLL